MKLYIKHPHHPIVKVKHAKHTAGLFTVMGGVVAYTPFHYLEAVFFTIAGCIAIYEPYIVHEVHSVRDDWEME